MSVRAIVVDLDGTLYKIGDRSPYDADLCGLDTVNEPIAAIVRWAREAGLAVLFVSGRGFQVTHRKYTEMALTWHGIEYDELFMREPGDGRPDAVVKREIFDRFIADNYDVFFVLDDNSSVVPMWRHDLGLTTLQVDDRV